MNAAAENRCAAAARYWDVVGTPVGPVGVTVDAAGRVVEIRLDGQPPTRGRRNRRHCRPVCMQLRQYFAGSRRRFDLELAPEGTAFQQRVWQALRGIDFGTVRHYADIARAVGQPQAARAVGQANAANPLPIVIPCHRVVASDGSIGGYSGGVALKHRLLALEGVEIDLGR